MAKMAAVNAESVTLTSLNEEIVEATSAARRDIYEHLTSEDLSQKLAARLSEILKGGVI